MDKLSKIDYATMVRLMAEARTVQPMLLDSLCLIGVKKVDGTDVTMKFQCKTRKAAEQLYREVIDLLKSMQATNVA